jgi:hypothetical protein
LSPLWDAENFVLTRHATTDDRDLYLPKILDLVLQTRRG